MIFGFGLIAGIVHLIKMRDTYEHELVMKNPGYTTGIITEVRTYKGKGVSVKYEVGGAQYSLKIGVTSEFVYTHEEGDTTSIIYSKADPSSAILKADLRPLTH